MIGIDGAELNNSMPTRVTMLLLGMAQGGLILLAEKPLARWLENRRVWFAAVAVNARIMTLYLWHLTAMVLLIGALLLASGVGLGVEPGSAAWWLTRPLWIGVLAVVVTGFVALLGRFENPRRDTRPAPPTWLAVLACVLTCGGLAVMAKFGMVDESGVQWWWPALPVAAQVLLRCWPAGQSRSRQARSQSAVSRSRSAR